ncbi:hypothetical protein EDD15DRAFT_2199060 [Pisolithus albus]|nr:hypothetical protein EDD15DRAFT_2199060 [Pisolithus albus]
MPNFTCNICNGHSPPGTNEMLTKKDGLWGEEEEEETEDDGHDRGKGQVILGQQKVLGPSSSLSSSIAVSPIAIDFVQESDESHPVDSHTANFGGKGNRKFVVVEGEDEHESDEDEDGKDGEDEEIREEEEQEEGASASTLLSTGSTSSSYVRYAVEKKEIECHLKQTHKNLGIFKVDSTHLVKVVEKLKVVSPLPTIKGPCSPVKGLPVVDAHACHLCSAFFTSQTNIRNHYTEHHKGSQKDWHRCKAQSLHTQGFGPYHKPWEVNVEPMQERKYLHQDLVNKLMEEVEKDLRVVVAPSDAHMVSPLLLKTGWHKKLVSLPTAEEAQWKGLRGATKAYIKKVVDLIDNPDTLVLKHLNSPDPVKHGICNVKCGVLGIKNE